MEEIQRQHCLSPIASTQSIFKDKAGLWDYKDSLSFQNTYLIAVLYGWTKGTWSVFCFFCMCLKDTARAVPCVEQSLPVLPPDWQALLGVCLQLLFGTTHWESPSDTWDSFLGTVLLPRSVKTRVVVPNAVFLLIFISVLGFLKSLQGYFIKFVLKAAESSKLFIFGTKEKKMVSYNPSANFTDQVFCSQKFKHFCWQ